MVSPKRIRFLALGGGTHPCRGPRHRGLRLARNVGGKGIRGRRGRGESQRGPRATRGGLAQVGPPRARCPRAGPARTRPARGPRATRGGLAQVGPPRARGARRVCARAVPARGDVFARALHNSRMRNPLYTSAQCPPPAPSESGAPDGEEHRSRPRPANDIGPPHRPGPAEASNDVLLAMGSRGSPPRQQSADSEPALN